jgi:hypothetical protein
MISAAFDSAALARFAGLYPEIPGTIAHGLADHPLFETEALVALAQRMRATDVEYNKADLPIGVDSMAVEANGLSLADTIRSIERNGSWMVLKFVEQDPLYRALLHDTLAELKATVGPVTGEMLKMEGFIFVSSPNAMTPFHFDPEHNILLQIRGSKTMTVFPPDDEEVVASTSHEAFHMGGHRNLPWRDEVAPKGRAFTLDPGNAIYVPVMSPHFVRNGPGPSVSFSVTWRSGWSFAEAQARGMNSLLRKAGLEPAAPQRFPVQNHAKAIAYRAIKKVTRTLGK